MKKANALKSAVALLLAGSMLAACGSTGSSSAAGSGSSSAATSEGGEPAAGDAAAGNGDKYVIGIAEAQANDEVTIRRAYLENFIAPTYNVEFIFSEVLKDDAATKTFIENCINSGADAVIDMKSANGTMAQLCQDAGLVYTFNGNYVSSPELNSTDYTSLSGCVGANNEQVGALFGDWLEEKT